MGNEKSQDESTVALTFSGLNYTTGEGGEGALSRSEKIRYFKTFGDHHYNIN